MAGQQLAVCAHMSDFGFATVLFPIGGTDDVSIGLGDSQVCASIGIVGEQSSTHSACG